MHHTSRAAIAIMACSLLTFGLAIAATPIVATQWSVQPSGSTLTFIGQQAGAEFEGAFEKFTADIRFDPKDLAGSRFDVTIDLSSVNSRDSERDEVLKGRDLFAVKQWPTARYVAGKFTRGGGNRWSATGKLTLRNVTRDVPLDFTFKSGDSGAWLRGTAKIKRLDFGVGQGEWQDTQWAGNEVSIRFALKLTPPGEQK